MTDLPDKERSPGYLVNEVSRLLKRRFEDEAKSFGVTMPQWRTLVEIHRQDGVSQVALAAFIDSDPMTMSGILDRLEKRGLIERFTDPNDSRAKLARLTREGVALVARARRVGIAMQEIALSGLSAEEREDLVEKLRHIRANLNNMTADQKEAV